MPFSFSIGNTPMKMIWNMTGDSIDLDVLMPSVFAYYLENQPNQFYPINLDDPTSSMQRLNHNLDKINSYLENMKLPSIAKPAGYSQEDLIRIHYEWVQLHRDYPRIEDICRRLDAEAPNVFYSTNKIIHSLEESFAVVVDNRANICVSNPFGNHIFTMGKSNISMDFSNLGRTTYNRWLNFATAAWDDTNNFDEFWGKLRINLDRPYDQSVPKQYREWCKEHKESPMGERILLANFRDLEKNLGTYRQIWIDNMAVDGNYIFFDSQD
jgi:hypothetical protein